MSAAAATGGAKKILCNFCLGEALAKCIKCDQPTCRDHFATHECKATDGRGGVFCTEHCDEKVSCGCSVCLQLFCALCLNKSNNHCPGSITGKRNDLIDKNPNQNSDEQPVLTRWDSRCQNVNDEYVGKRQDQHDHYTGRKAAFRGQLRGGYGNPGGLLKSNPRMCMPRCAVSASHNLSAYGTGPPQPAKRLADHSFCSIPSLEESCKTLLADQMAIARQVQENMSIQMEKAHIKGDTAEAEGRKGLQDYKNFAHEVVQRFYQKIQNEAKQIEIYLKGLRKTHDDYIAQLRTRNAEVLGKIEQGQKILEKESVEQLVQQTNLFVPEIMTLNEQIIPQFQPQTKTILMQDPFLPDVLHWRTK